MLHFPKTQVRKFFTRGVLEVIILHVQVMCSLSQADDGGPSGEVI
jgi:hypothetical protein